MIKDGVEYKKCPQCKRLCLALEIKNGICKDCRIENLEKENEQLKQKIEELKKKKMLNLKSNAAIMKFGSIKKEINSQ